MRYQRSVLGTQQERSKMTEFVHIVQVHPVENGEPNLHKVLGERKYEKKEWAESFAEWLNLTYKNHNEQKRAVYLGCVNDETGELV